jgi:hypothetical protein
MTTISVALTTYNGERFLSEQLSSIAAQTRLPDELVVADDNSHDQTWSMLSAFAARAPFPVRLHRNETRLGWRDNFMCVLGRCASDLIALCDQDDRWHPGKLAAAETAMREPDDLLFCHDAWCIDESGRRTGPAAIFPQPQSTPPLSSYSFYSPYGFSMVFRRSLLVLSDLWQCSTDSNDRARRAPHDQWLYFLATILGTVKFSPERLVDYRQHDGNAVGLPAPRGMLDRLRRARGHWLNNPETRFRILSAVARDRAEILQAGKDMLTGVQQERALLGRERYLQLAHQLAARADLYAGRRASDRAKKLRRLVDEGVYRGANAWEFSRAALARDAILAVTLRPLLV